jgi:iron complex outermembrane receptor protein
MTERFITLLPVGYDNYDYLGNPQLLPEANHQVDLTSRFSNPRLGNLEVNGFFSLVTDYITGMIIPPSEQKPATSGVLGVKRFYNADKAFFRGFEFVYGTPAHLRWYIQWIAAFTRATIDEAVMHTMNPDGQITGTETVQNDALAEIPPFETTFILGYKFMNGKLIPKVKARYVAHQEYVSKAFYEKPTPDFFVGSLSCSYFHNEHFTITAGIDNVFDNAYYEHLNRRVIGSTEDIYEPGINVYLNLVFKL